MAEDPDTGPGGRVRYSCAESCGEGHFAVSPADGKVLVRRRLDADMQDALHVIHVIATDGGSASLSATATVSIDGL